MSSWSEGLLRLVQFWMFYFSIGLPLLGVLLGSVCLVVRDRASHELGQREACARTTRQETEAELRRKAEGALRAQLELALKKAREAPTQPSGRSISSEQSARFVSAVEFSLRGKVSVQITSGVDPETVAYANQIRDMIAAAGYDAGTKVEVGFAKQIPSGVFMLVGHPQHPFAGAIQQAFGAIGINATGLIDDSIRGDEVRVEVGVKP